MGWSETVVIDLGGRAKPGAILTRLPSFWSRSRVLARLALGYRGAPQCVG